MIAGAGFAMMARAEAYRQAGWAGSPAFYMLERGCICRVCSKYYYILENAHLSWLFSSKIGTTVRL
jgi:hypothetical protein